MDKDIRKFAVLNLALALVVLVLFGLAPLTVSSRYADSVFMPAGSDAVSGDGTGTFAAQ